MPTVVAILHRIPRPPAWYLTAAARLAEAAAATALTIEPDPTTRALLGTYLLTSITITYLRHLHPRRRRTA